jgi:hypothetical protein
MENLIEKAKNIVETETLRLAAQNLEHLININKEQVTLDNIVTSLKNTLIDAKSDTPEELENTLIVQARILDATFLYFLDTSKKSYSELERVGIALKSQRQMLGIANTLRYLKRDKVAHQEKFSKIAKQTEQNTTKRAD